MRRLAIVFVAFVVVVAAAALLLPGASSRAPERIWIPEGFDVGSQPSRQPGGPPIAGMCASFGGSNGGRYYFLHFTRPPTPLERALQYVGFRPAPHSLVFRPTGLESPCGSVTWFEFSRRER
jgi:hypothetical protein